MATIICPRFRPQMSTVRPGVMQMQAFDQAGADKVVIENVAPALTADDIHVQVLDIKKSAEKLVDLIGADVVVAVGRGISADPEKKKISLGMKDHSQDPWTVFTSTYQVGDVANVRIVKLMTFGAFAEIVPGVDGLIHISQIADHRIEKPGDVLAEGDKVDVKITDVDMENKKVSLSIRALLEAAPAEEEPEVEE